MAAQHRRYLTFPRHVRVVMSGHDFTSSATESELRKIRSKMCEWYDVKVRGILGTGKRDAREMEIMGRDFRWPEEGLEYEVSDKTSSCAAQVLSGDAELLELGQVGRAVRREGDIHEVGESDTTKLEKVEEGMRILEESGESDVGVAGLETRRYNRGCARGFGLGKKGPKGSDEW